MSDGPRPGVVHRLLLSQVRRDAVGSLLIKVITTALGFATTVLLARLLGAEGYGFYSYALALVMLLSLPTQAGLPNLVMRETALGTSLKEPDLVKGIWVWSARITTVLSLLAALAAAVVLLIMDGAQLDLQRATIAWAVALVPLVALGDLRGAALRGLNRVVPGLLPEFLIRPALLVVSLLIVYLIGLPLAAPTAMLLHVAAAGIAFAVGAWLLWAYSPPEVKHAEPRTNPSLWRSSLIPLAMIGGFAVLSGNVDILVLGWFRSADEVGIYRVAVQGSITVTFGLQAIVPVVAPRFVDLHTRGDTAGLQRLLNASTRFVVGFGVSVAVILFAFGRPILAGIFGTEFVAGYLPLVIAVAGYLVQSAFGSVGYLLMMSRNERDTVRATAIGLVSNVALNLMLIPAYGGAGAAAATHISLTVMNLWQWYSARKRLGVDCLGWMVPGSKRAVA